MTEKTILPIAELLNELIGDQSSDYNDGDHPGYYSWTYDPEMSLLAIQYDADDEAEHAPTLAVLKFVGAGPVQDDDEDGE